jgi:hypothetical protein
MNLNDTQIAECWKCDYRVERVKLTWPFGYRFVTGLEVRPIADFGVGWRAPKEFLNRKTRKHENRKGRKEGSLLIFPSIPLKIPGTFLTL